VIRKNWDIPHYLLDTYRRPFQLRISDPAISSLLGYSSFKISIQVKPGHHKSERELNKQPNDKERERAAMEEEKKLMHFIVLLPSFSSCCRPSQNSSKDECIIHSWRSSVVFAFFWWSWSWLEKLQWVPNARSLCAEICFDFSIVVINEWINVHKSNIMLNSECIYYDARIWSGNIVVLE
jgi:hypothetical protein